MKIIEKTEALRHEIAQARQTGKLIGLVPTMGALHDGHISLVNQALKDNLYVVVTIFVNPTQFNDPKDLESYPRNMEKDLQLLNARQVDLVFTPMVSEMYPTTDKRVFDLDPLDKLMEGKYRPGHFNGVAQIVTKLFEIVMPDKAFFGQKDFQQLAIIRKVADAMKMNIDIVGCPIIREKNGVAMSSRNQLLGEEERKAAPLIFKTLKEVKAIHAAYNPEEIKEIVKEKISRHPLMELEYFEIVEGKNLKPIDSWNDSKNIVGCIAVYLNKVRLIDNIYFS